MTSEDEAPPPPPSPGSPVSWPSRPPRPPAHPPGNPVESPLSAGPPTSEPAPPGMPPPPAWPSSAPQEPRSSGRPTWIVVLVVVALVVAGGAAWLVGRGPAAPVGGDAPATDAPPPAAPRSAAPTPTLDAATVEAHRELFRLIDESERTMIDFLTSAPSAPTEPLTDAQLAEAAAQAERAATDLEDLRERLRDSGAADSPSGVTTIREAYLVHLGDWIDWTSAVAADPGVLTGDGSQPHDAAINESAAGFVAAVEDVLGDRSGLPDDLAALVDLVIERGFSSGGDDLGEI